MFLRYGILVFLCTFSLRCYAEDRPQWRGLAGVNHAAQGATAPLAWSQESGLAWRTPLPGRGNSSPTLVGDFIYLTAGDELTQTQSLLILDRVTGELIRQVVVHEGNLPKDLFPKNSHANSSVDGRLYYRFEEDGQDYLAAIGEAFEEETNLEPDREYSVMVVTGGHEYDEPEFKSMFDSMEGISCEFVLTEDMQAISANEIADRFDTIVMLDMVRDRVEENAKQQFLDLSRSGVGMVFLHFTLASRPYWDEYHDMVGGKFYLPNVEKDASRHSTYTTDLEVEVRVLNPAHPVTRGMRDFVMTDAFYGNSSISPEATPLLASSHQNTATSIAWTHQFGSSRVVYFMPGFTKHAYEDTNYRKFLRNAIRYVAD